MFKRSPSTFCRLKLSNLIYCKLYGRNEAPVPLFLQVHHPIALSLLEACRIAIEHMTPVFFFSDGYIANGAEPWLFLSQKILKKRFHCQKLMPLLPYKRNEKFVREWSECRVLNIELEVSKKKI